ncbi:MAG: hypothetical protein ACR2OE_05315, partial [Thermomicrobiales bacterium]
MNQPRLPPPPPPTEIFVPTSEPTEPPIEIPTAPEPTAAATDAPLPSSTTETSAPSPSPSPTSTVAPSLTYELGDALNCQPETSTAEIRHGSSIDYRCTLDLSIAGHDLPAGTVRIDWQLAAAGGGWSVQLRIEDAEWSGQLPEVSVSHREEFPTSALASGEDITRTVSLGLRISRDRCITSGGAVVVTGGATVSLPGITGASIQVPSRTTAKGEVAPALVPIPEPSLAFVGALDLGTVDLGPLTSPTSTSGTITLNVTGLDQSCG